ncbi:hypothetical protein DFH28DRAFT_951009 [Melampsora americana]|nr:hypothetical protein DFH28DRAFT_951009 [Melampsora americana]
MSQTQLIDAPVHAIQVNPFRIQLQFIRRVSLPQFPPWALDLLILLAVMRSVIILSCISIMVIPLFKGPAAQKRHYTLIRRVYPQQSRGTPYLVPNRSMVIAICETMSGVLYLLGVIASFKFYSGGEFSEGPMTHITTLVSIWISAWSLVHACLCDVEGNKNSRLSRFLTPSLYNVLWISGSILVILVNIYWAIRVTLIFSRFESVIGNVFRLLERAVKLWDTNQNRSGIPLARINVAVRKLATVKDPLKLVIIGWAQTWTFLLTILTIFYLVTVRLLLRMLRHVLKIRDSEAFSLQAQSAIWIELEKETRVLSFLSIAVTLSIVGQVFVGILQWITASHLGEPDDWRIKSSLFNHLPGIFMVPAQLVQSWRIFSERSAADETNFQMIPMDLKNRELPQMTSQLLGWDTTVFWGQEPCMNDVNFPGLCELPPREFDHPYSSAKKLPGSIKIEVVQSSISTEGSV